MSQIRMSFSDNNNFKDITIADPIKFVQALCIYYNDIIIRKSCVNFLIIVKVHSTSCIVIVLTGDICTHRSECVLIDNEHIHIGGTHFNQYGVHIVTDKYMYMLGYVHVHISVSISLQVSLAARLQ